MTTLTAPAQTNDQQANGAALARLFDEHGRMVLGICRIYLKDEYEAEDAAQETFISAHRSLLSGCQPEQSGPWLAAIARNECRDRIRGLARRNTTAVPQETIERHALVGGDTLADDMDRNAALQAALADLPDSQREAFVLREMFGLRYDEIASALETTDSAVESLLVRARRALKSHLGGKRLVPVALVVPFALRESLAHAVAGFPLAPAASGGVAAAAGSAGGSLGSGGTGGAGAQTGATQLGGAATSGTVGTSAGTGSALGTTAAASAAASSATASGATAIAGVTKVLATPILAKLAIAGAATTMVATMAVSTPWNAEPRSARPAPVSEGSGSDDAQASGVAGARAELAASDGGFAVGAELGLSDGTDASDRRDKKKATKKQRELKGRATPAEKPAKAETVAPAGATVAAGGTDANSGEPSAEATPTSDAPEKSDEVDAGPVDAEQKSNHGNGKKRGHEADGPGNSNDAPGHTKKLDESDE